MSFQRRHDKSPSKQHRPSSATVGGYGSHDPNEFQQTGSIAAPQSSGAQPTNQLDAQMPELASMMAPQSPAVQ